MLTEVATPIYDITAAGVILVPTTRAKFKGFILSGGTAGSVLTFNDAATLGTAGPANQIISYTLPEGAMVCPVGDNGWLDWPLLNGLVVSAFPTGGAVLAVVCTEFVQ
jgi:hypothetical protein